jgi:hypothetical protein
MSLAIDPNDVTSILLPVTGWLAVVPGSFDLDSYEIIERGDPYDPEQDHAHMGQWEWEQKSRFTLHGGGQYGICAVGFACRVEDGARISGPFTSILAIETRKAPEQ